MPDKHEVDAANSSSPIAIVIVPANTNTKAKLNVKIMERVASFDVLEMDTKGWSDHRTWTWKIMA